MRLIKNQLYSTQREVTRTRIKHPTLLCVTQDIWHGAGWNAKFPLIHKTSETQDVCDIIQCLFLVHSVFKKRLITSLIKKWNKPQSKKNTTSEGHWNSYHSVHDQWTTDNILHGQDKASVVSTNVEKIFISQYCLLLLKQLDGIYRIISQSTADCRATEEDETLTEKQTSSKQCATTDTLVYHLWASSIIWYDDVVQTIMSKTISRLVNSLFLMILLWCVWEKQA